MITLTMNRLRKLFLGLIMVIPVFQSCEKVLSEIEEPSHPSDSSGYSGTILENRRLTARGELISGVRWTPVGLIPTVNGGFFDAGLEYTGIPYSSVKELDKFVGIDVSCYTFLSAMRNPYSVLYTEDVSNPPYHGIGCGPFYGTVCSTTVNYALGLGFPLSTRLYPDFTELFHEIENQDISEVRPGCIMLKRGSHVVVVTKVWIDSEGRVENVRILEATKHITSFFSYTAEQFLQRWKDSSWVMYQYMKMDEIPEVEENPDAFIYNDDLCTTRGDNVCYRVGEPVTFSILNGNYVVLELYKDGVLYDSKEIVGCESLTYDNLPFGDYAAYLINGKDRSMAMHFEVIETNVSLTENGKYLTIDFSSSNGTPQYIIIGDCSTFKSNRIILLTPEDKTAGCVIIRTPSNRTQFFKVYFTGRYGVIANEHMYLQ